jgi:hypothetical protein
MPYEEEDTCHCRCLMILTSVTQKVPCVLTLFLKITLYIDVYFSNVPCVLTLT